MDDDQSLRTAVEAQARALVRGDLAAFGSYAMPEALGRLYRSQRLRGIRTFELTQVEENGERGMSVVRLTGPSTCELHGAWEFVEGRWKAVALDIPVDAVRAPLWRRLFRREKPSHPAREELA